MNESADLRNTIGKLIYNIGQERDRAENLESFLEHPIEREPGIWEYDFEELEKEMWRRFATLEKYQECRIGDNKYFVGRIKAKILPRLNDLMRKISSPFSRTRIDQRHQFDLDRQDFLNREQIPFLLGLILTQQKMKDRLNQLEEENRRLRASHEELFRDMVGIRFLDTRKESNKEGRDHDE